MRTRRGAVMVLTLAVLAGVVAALAMATAAQRLAFRAGLNRMEGERSRIAAEAAVSYAMATLVSQSRDTATLQDDWATLGQNGDERFLIGDVSFRLQIVDASSRISLNSATREQFERLGLTTEQMDSLLDWREPGNVPRAEGAKDEYYNNLSQPYNAKLRAFDSVDELLLVKGFTPATLYEPLETVTPLSSEDIEPPALIEIATVDSVARDVTPEGQAKLNINSGQANVQTLVQRGQISPALAAQIVVRRTQQGPFTSIGQVLSLPGVSQQDAANVLDRFSTTAQQRLTGRMNLNTVSEAALNAIPDLSPDQVQAILARQATGFTRLGDLASLPGLGMQTLAQVAGLFTINSQVFVVRILGEAGAAGASYEAIVSIEGDAPRLLRMSESQYDAVDRWGWSADPQIETTLTEAQ